MDELHFNRPYDPQEMQFLQDEIKLLTADPALPPINDYRDWEYGRVLAFCKRYLLKPSAIIDVGGAGSTLSAIISTLGHNVTVVDINPSGADLVKSFRDLGYLNVFWIPGPAEALPYRDQGFDCVMSISVIEHIPDDRSALEEMVRVLKPGGYLVLSFDFVKEARPSTIYQERFYTQDSVEEMITYLSARDLSPIEPWDYSYAGEHIAWGDPLCVYNGAMLILRKS